MGPYFNEMIRIRIQIGNEIPHIAGMWDFCAEQITSSHLKWQKCYQITEHEKLSFWIWIFAPKSYFLLVLDIWIFAPKLNLHFWRKISNIFFFYLRFEFSCQNHILCWFWTFEFSRQKWTFSFGAKIQTFFIDLNLNFRAKNDQNFIKFWRENSNHFCMIWIFAPKIIFLLLCQKFEFSRQKLNFVLFLNIWIFPPNLIFHF